MFFLQDWNIFSLCQLTEMERDLPTSLWVSSDDETFVPEMKYFFSFGFIALSINVLMLTKILSRAATNGMETLSPVCLPTERPSTPLGCSALVLSALFVSTTQLRSQLKGHFSHQTRVWDKTNLCFRSHPLSCDGRWAGCPKVDSNEGIELAVATIGATSETSQGLR